MRKYFRLGTYRLNNRSFVRKIETCIQLLANSVNVTDGLWFIGYKKYYFLNELFECLYFLKENCVLRLNFVADQIAPSVRNMPNDCTSCVCAHIKWSCHVAGLLSACSTCLANSHSTEIVFHMNIVTTSFTSLSL